MNKKALNKVLFDTYIDIRRGISCLFVGMGITLIYFNLDPQLGFVLFGIAFLYNLFQLHRV